MSLVLFYGVRRNLYADSVISPDMAALEESYLKSIFPIFYF